MQNIITVNKLIIAGQVITAGEIFVGIVFSLLIIALISMLIAIHRGEFDYE